MIATGQTLQERAPSTRRAGYLVYLIALMGLVAVMDQYLSMIKTSALPYILKEYNTTASGFSWLESLSMIPTFFIVFLNGLNDLIGRRLSILILVTLMGLSALGIVVFANSLYAFMAFYGLAIFTTVSNMWTIPISEESPAGRRGLYVSIVYVIGLLPLQALLPPLLVNTLGLSWKWMYGAMFVMMIPVLVLWLGMKETHRYQVVQQERRAGLRRTRPFGLGAIDRRDLRYIAVSAAIWICWLVTNMLYNWAGYYFMTIHGYSLARWSLVLLAGLIMAMIGGVVGGWVMDRLGRRASLIAGSLGITVVLCGLGFASGWLLPVLAALSGFFVSLSYTWIVVYVPEVFPTERRGACMGWTTTIARVAFVGAPLMAGALLRAFPRMDWFWVAAGLVMILPVCIVLLLHPAETGTRELEEIEAQR